MGWQRQADLTEQLYAQAQHAVDSAPWKGAAADRASAKLFENLVKIRGAIDLLEKAAKIATAGADAIDAAKRAAVAAIDNAVSQFFAVSEDLAVTDRMPAIFGAALALVRKIAAMQFQADIRGKAMMLAQTDENVAEQLDAIAGSMQGFDLEGGKGGVPKPGDPQIVGNPTPLTPEGTQGDLNATIPGTGIEISGDGRTTYPTLNGEKNPLEVPEGSRPLPTGTIVGPDGKQYAMYSEVPYKLPNGDPNPDYATADTTVVDMNDPKHAIGVLPGISQASGVYDPATNRMIIVGNDGPHDRTRRLYTSDPIDPKNPNGWMKTLQPKGVIEGLPGDRESQLVALKGGGFMLVGSDDYSQNVPGDQPMGVITASSADGLLHARATPLFPPGQGTWPGGAPPYGPTVVDTVYDPVTGKETVQLRVSTWERPPGWVPTPDHQTMPYNPKTYRTEITVAH
jgi:hypothetical protein